VASSGTASSAGTRIFANESSVSSWTAAMSDGATRSIPASRSAMRAERQPRSQSAVRNGVDDWVTAWFAATMTPSSGSSAQGSSEKSTKPCQSYVESHPGAGQ
jgi:hypothetical protein